MTTIQFLGGAGTTTGSKYLLTHNDQRTLIDCGLFQGTKYLRQLNWAPFPIKPKDIREVLLTHAHIDHSGYLPRLVHAGFHGPIHATSGTTDLAKVMLPDAAHIQEEDARFANKKRFSRHDPALPLYTVADAEATLKLFKSHPYDQAIPLREGFSFRMRDAGHILGSATVELDLTTDGHAMKIVFSGDLGRYNAPILNDPAPVWETDYLLIESTYGDRLHETESPSDILADVITKTVARGGSVIIPSFAVGRAQTLLYLLRELLEQNKIPQLPIYLDSPLAVDATEIFRRHSEDYDPAMLQLGEAGTSPFAFKDLHLVRTVEASKALNHFTYPCIIISSSGMATSGRVLHHLKWRLPDPRHTVLLVGYQAVGTRGYRLQQGERVLKIHGEIVPVRAEVRSIGGLSAHADYQEILTWLRHFQRPPRTTFIVHGEPESNAGLAAHIKEQLGWLTYIPHLREKITLQP